MSGDAYVDTINEYTQGAGVTVSEVNISQGTVNATVLEIAGVPLNTSLVPENTNLYFTDARARAALSIINGLNMNCTYNSATGVLTFATNALTTSVVSEGSQLYFTVARVLTALSAGFGISFSGGGVIANTLTCDTIPDGATYHLITTTQRVMIVAATAAATAGTLCLRDGGGSAAFSTLTVNEIEPPTGTLSIGTSASIIDIGCGSGVQTINLGADSSTGVTTINLGGVGDTVNVNGTLTYVNTTNLEVANKTMILNEASSGSGTARSAGIYFWDNSVNMQGYILTSSLGTSFVFQAPESTYLLSSPVLTANATIARTSDLAPILSVTNGLNMNCSYSSITGVLTLATNALTTTAVAEGTNLYFTNARAAAAISIANGTNMSCTYNSSTGVLTLNTGPNVAFTTLNVSGTSNLSVAAVSSTLGVTGTSTLGVVNCGNLAVTGTQTVSSTLGVTGTSTLGVVNCGNLGITGTLGATGTSTLAAVNCGNLAVMGTQTVSSTLGVTGTSTLGAVNCGNLAVTGTESVSGIVSFTAATISSSAATGALVVTGGAGVGGAMYVTGNTSHAGVVSVTNSTASTSAGSGALLVTGGVGVGGAIYSTGDHNTGGNLVLPVTTSSVGNINLGGNARIFSYPTSSGNLFAGNAVGNYILTGTNNNVFGNQSGVALAAGGANTIYGSAAGAGITSANYNTHIGYESGNTGNGTGNACLGAFAGQACPTNYNTCVGYSAGSIMASGSGLNCLIGYASGDGLTTGMGNIIVGGHPGSAAQSNATIIGSFGANGYTAQSACYIDGIAGKTPGGTSDVVIIAPGGQLGTVGVATFATGAQFANSTTSYVPTTLSYYEEYSYSSTFTPIIGGGQRGDYCNCSPAIGSKWFCCYHALPSMDSNNCQHHTRRN